MLSFQFVDAIRDDKWEVAVEIFFGEDMWARVANPDPDKENPQPDEFVTTIFFDALSADLVLSNEELISAFVRARNMLLT